MAICDDKHLELFKSQPLFCPGCRGLYVDPVTDFCGHTYCHLCTEENEFCVECTNDGEEDTTFGRFGKLKVNIVLSKIVEKFADVDEMLEIKKEAFKLYKCGDYEKVVTFIGEAVVKGTAPDIFLMLLRSKCFLAMGQPLLALRDVDVIIEFTNKNTQSYLLKTKALKSLSYEKESAPLDRHLLRSNEVDQSDDWVLKGHEQSPSSSLTFKDDSEITKNSPQCSSSSQNPSSAHKTCRSKCYFLKTFCKRPTKICSSKMKSFQHSHAAHLCPPSTNISDSLIAADKMSRSMSDYVVADGSPKLSIVLEDPQSIISRVTHLIKSEDLECPLCLKIFLDPVTTTCGHTFCLDCMYRSLDHAPTCPLCKENLQTYLASRTRSSTKAICWLLETFFSEEMEGRRGSRREEMMTLEGITRGEKVPIFVCTVAFPSVCCPLHVFEPRYKLMVRRCLDSETKQFGMCGLPSSDCEQEFASLGTMLEILSAKYSHDGRSILHSIGRRRFRILEKDVRDGYYEARVEYVQDEPVLAGEFEEIMDLMRRIYSKCQAWFNSLCQERMKCIILHYGPFPSLDTPPTTILPHLLSPNSTTAGCPFFRPNLTKGCPMSSLRNEKFHPASDPSKLEKENEDLKSPTFFPEDGPSWIWYMTAILPVGEEVKKALLSLTSVKCRLKYLDGIVSVALKGDAWK